jgi:molybdopterin molybdotransferase
VAAELIGVPEARARVLACVEPLPPEHVDLDDALGRILAEDVRSEGDLPSFDASAMDGYATQPGPAAELNVIGESRAGRPAMGAVGPGEAMRISTGAAIPEGADAVVPIERVEVAEAGARGEPGGGSAGERIWVPARAPGDHIRRAGEDVRASALVLRAGRTIGPAEVAVLAAVGRGEVACGALPAVAILATGDELVEPGAPLGPGHVRDSNGPALAALAARAGARLVQRHRATDELAATTDALAEALDLADVVCVSGGVSVGEHDHVKAALGALGVERRFWGVSLRPGKPTWFGTLERRLVFGLPGNPVSAAVTFHLFVRPTLARLAGARDALGRRVPALLDEPVARHRTREQAVRVSVEACADGLRARPTGAQGSHILSSLLDADALLLVAPGDGELPAGERVELEPLG